MISTDISPTLTTTHGGEPVICRASQDINPPIATALDACYYKGCGMRAGIERTVVVEKHTAEPISCDLNHNITLGHITQDVSGTLTTKPMQTCVCYENHTQASRYNPLGEVCSTMTAGYGTGGNNIPIVVEINDIPQYTVRRLTPLECERLQGYPDGWTDIGDWTDSKGKTRKLADTSRYKSLGNSIALPFWEWMAGRMCGVYGRPIEMASLFDGIGGFPLVFSRCGAIPVWASEIDEFCLAVTKLRFP